MEDVPHIKEYLEDVDPLDYPLSENEKTLFFKRGDKLYIHENTKSKERLVEEFDVISVERPTSATRRGRVAKGMVNTITTVPFQVVYAHGALRHLTACEIFRLMGFSDKGYNALVKDGLTPKQIKELSGNSICVPVLEDIMKIILNELEKEKQI